MIIGQAIPTNDEWKKTKYKYMLEILRQKVIASPKYKEFLLSTLTKIYIENTCHPYWGRGKNNCGKNMLGALHAKIRSEVVLSTKKLDEF